MKLSGIFNATLLGVALTGASVVNANEADIYSVQFSEDGKYIITGGNGGYTLAKEDQHSGGIKVWDSSNGRLIESMGKRGDLDTVFGNTYGRIGGRRWGISNFKDVVLNGSYPNGKVILLPSSLGLMVNQNDVKMPGIVGAHMDFAGKPVEQIDFNQFTKEKGDCAAGSGFHDYIGPIVPSDNGKYAAIVVNTCHAQKASTDGAVRYEYNSDLHIMDLSNLKVSRSIKNIDAGVYALGISDNGKRAAFVGRDSFTVLDLKSGDKHIVEAYEDAQFVIPRQFSKLHFTKDGNKLVSLRNIYDINTGEEAELKWVSSKIKKPRRISSIKIAPNLDYFALVIPKRSLIMFGDDGLPQSYGKADKVLLLNAKTGKQIELEVTDSMNEGKRCVTDISPDSKRVVVGCKGGILRIYSAKTGKVIWKKHNIGKKDTARHLLQTRSTPNDQYLAMLN